MPLAVSSPVRGRIAALLVLAVLARRAEPLRAQGATTAGITGRVADVNGIGLPDVEVTVTNRATGVSTRSVSRAEGRYVVGGLEVGGPYEVVARRVGSRTQPQTGIYLSVGQQRRVDVQLEQQPVLLQGMETRAAENRQFSRAHQGAESFLSDSLIHQLPVINRDLYDLVRLVPQMSTWYALTASGANPRANSIRIDGVGDQVPSSNLAAGQLYGGKVLPLDAVKEYQVLLAPYDVRYGGFAGAGINVVTRSGTNDFHGSIFGYGTNERLGPDVPFVRGSPYEKGQFGFSLGGPIVHDRLHFFVASELQRRRIPAFGPNADEPLASEPMLPVRPADIARFQQLLTARGLEGGSAGAVANPNPSSSVFLRLDAPIRRWNSRVTVRGTFGQGDSSIFARPTMLAPTNCTAMQCFPLSSLQHSRWVDKRSGAAQLVTNFARGAYNEMLLGYTKTVSGFRPTVKQPLVLVMVPGVNGAPAVLQAGTHEIATGQRNDIWSTELTDNFTIPAGAHRITAGLSTQLFDMRAFQLRGGYGVWEFASLDSMDAGIASRYRITRDTGSVTAASGSHHAVYLGDEWSASSRLSLTYGLRADIPVISARPPYVGVVDTALGVRSDGVPSRQVAWSPRLGFNYDLTRDGGAPTQLRGGAGVFTGRSPLFWLFGGFSAYGLAVRTLQCGSLPTDAGTAPAFSADYRNPPFACAGGQTFGSATKGEIDVLSPHLSAPQTLRASLALDRQLALGMTGTIEGLYTRSTRSVFFSGINLARPLGTDARGRVLYGSVAPSGIATPRRISARVGDVIAVTNQSKDYAYDITGELRRQGALADMYAAVSYGHARDVQSPRPVSSLLIDDWRFGRPVAGRQDDIALGTSDYDQPFRLRASGTVHSPWRRLRTDLSVFYVGGSGFPYTYVAGGTQGRGDLNADGAVGNDPIYIPRTSFDSTEIRFGGSPSEVATQQSAFERFIDGASCLRAQRGHIMSRNSCRSPWTHLVHLALRQRLPSIQSQSATAEVQVFNLLNLLDSRWGHVQLPEGTTIAATNQLPLLSQVGATPGSQAQPVFRFDPTARRYQFENVDSFYQIQLALRYSF